MNFVSLQKLEHYVNMADVSYCTIPITPISINGRDESYKIQLYSSRSNQGLQYHIMEVIRECNDMNPSNLYS